MGSRGVGYWYSEDIGHEKEAIARLRYPKSYESKSKHIQHLARAI
ncbi:MAG: hypothetical protein AB4080_01925 [Trichodesmium sp.]